MKQDSYINRMKDIGFQKSQSDSQNLSQYLKTSTPDEKFSKYMATSGLAGNKIGAYLKNWLNIGVDKGIKIEVCRKQISDWIERNSAMFK